jgi:hypothetical protein
MNHKSTLEIATKYAQTLFLAKDLDLSVRIFEEVLETQVKEFGAQSIKVG